MTLAPFDCSAVASFMGRGAGAKWPPIRINIFAPSRASRIRHKLGIAKKKKSPRHTSERQNTSDGVNFATEQETEQEQNEKRRGDSKEKNRSNSADFRHTESDERHHDRGDDGGLQ